METNSPKFFCIAFATVLQGLLPVSGATVTCNTSMVQNSFGEMYLVFPSPITGTVCQFTFQDPKPKDSTMLLIRVLVVKNYKASTDSVKFPDGSLMSTNYRVWNDMTSEPECYGFVKDETSVNDCSQRLKQICNSSKPKLATDWPPKFSVYSQKGTFVFTYSFLECPSAPPIDPAVAALAVLFSVTLVVLVIIVYLIMRDKFIKRERKDNGNLINEYALPSYKPMPDAASRTGTLQIPVSNQHRSPSVQSQLNNAQIVSLQSIQLPMENATMQRQISEPRASPVTPPATLAPLVKGPDTPVQLTASAPVSVSTTGNNSSGVYENPSGPEVYEMPIRHENLEYMDFNEPEGQVSTPDDVYTNDVREAGN